MTEQWKRLDELDPPFNTSLDLMVRTNADPDAQLLRIEAIADEAYEGTGVCRYLINFSDDLGFYYLDSRDYTAVYWRLRANQRSGSSDG